MTTLIPYLRTQIFQQESNLQTTIYQVSLLLVFTSCRERKCDLREDMLSSFVQDHFFCVCVSTETPPPGYISEDGEASDQQMNQSMDTGTLD